MVAIHNDSDTMREIEPFERIAQLIIQPYMPVNFNETNKLNDTVRGENGFGSSGNK